MTNNGDDCYFFYYSTCSKGDSCPFRHCEAAMGNETVCNLWKEGRCFRTVCMFRHMEITKNRKEISCYWENQAAGCQKPHCAFFHQKPRYIDGVFVPADKSQMKSEEVPQEEPAPAPAAPLPAAAANPQLRGVIKTEAQEPVPSPTHPPVVINPADDDEDEDDQFSEEGEDGRVGPSPRKQKSGDSLNFGVSTLEEIRLRKALKASMKRAGYPIQSAAAAAASTNGEKENIRSLFHPALVEPRHAEPLVFEETGRPRGSVAERLGRKMSNTESRRAEGVALKRSLADRLGRVVEEEDSSAPPQKALKPVKERLGLSAGSVSPSHPAETNTEPKKAPEQIRIKTLEQIRQEKAAKSQKQKDGTSDDDAAPEKPTAGRPPRGGRRAITLKKDSISEIKTFSEILRAKKKSQEEQQQQMEKKTSPDADRPAPDVTDGGQVRVKTLEEIRRDKAARMQTQQTTEDKKSSDSEESSAKKPRLLRMKKPAPERSNTAAESSPDVTEKLQKPRAAAAAAAAAAAPESNSANGVKVKTFEEIMQEKRLRKQQMEEQAKNSAEAEPSEKPTPEETLKRKTPVRVSFTSPSSTSQLPDTTTSTQRPPVRKLVPLRSKAASPPNSVGSAPATQSSPPPESDSRSQSPSSSREVPQSPAKQARGAPRAAAAAAAAEDKTASSNKKTTPEVAANTRVRPKLNVKPSVVKPAVHVKPGQKRKAAQRSAVAAVKPLNSASTVQEESLQETACKDKRVSPSSCADALLTSAVPSVPSSLLDSACSSSPLTEDLQTVPVFSQSRETKSSVGALGGPAPRETCCTVPQSPVLKAPAQPKSRRLSAAASRSASTSSSTTAAAAAASSSSSALDDFDELISEFTDDHMEGDMDPAIGEDDLLQELSDMIDS